MITGPLEKGKDTARHVTEEETETAKNTCKEVCIWSSKRNLTPGLEKCK